MKPSEAHSDPQQEVGLLKKTSMDSDSCYVTAKDISAHNSNF